MEEVKKAFVSGKRQDSKVFSFSKGILFLIKRFVINYSPLEICFLQPHDLVFPDIRLSLLT